jgi:hypothetical protein
MKFGDIVAPKRLQRSGEKDQNKLNVGIESCFSPTFRGVAIPWLKILE